MHFVQCFTLSKVSSDIGLEQLTECLTSILED